MQAGAGEAQGMHERGGLVGRVERASQAEGKALGHAGGCCWGPGCGAAGLWGWVQDSWSCLPRS